MNKQFPIVLLLLAAALLPVAGQNNASPAGQNAPMPAAGQDPAQPMTLRDCMAYAISHSTRIRIQQASNDDARIARREALLGVFLPTISAGTSASASFGRNIDPETNTYINTVSFSNSYSLGAGITLFNGFSAVNNLKIARTRLRMGQTQEKQTEADICLKVMQAFYNVLYYKRLVKNQEEQAEHAAQLLRQAQRQEELGQKGHADVVQLEADLAGRRYDLINTTNLYNNYRVDLEDLLFWPEDEELVLDETQVPGLDDERTAFVLTGDRVPLSNPDTLVSFALAHNPAVRLAAWEVENSRLELRTARWQLLPSISVSGSWGTSYYNYAGTQQVPYFDMLRRNAGQGIGVSMSIPILNRLSRLNNVARRRNALARTTAEYDQKQREVESEVRKAVQDRDGAAAAFEQASLKAAVEQEAYLLNTRKLEQGLISPLEYQNAVNNYIRAGADRLNSLFSYLIKQSVVRYYGGEDYIDQ